MRCYCNFLDSKEEQKVKVVAKKNITVNNEKENISSLISQKIIKTNMSKTLAKKDFGLSDTEKKVYGNRWPSWYEKLSLLGRGGCALVWLAINLQTNETVALKQFVKKQSSISSAKVEAAIFEALDLTHTSDHQGHNHISHLLDQINEGKDVWLVYEVGGNSLSKMLFEVKGEFHNGERIYFVNHQSFYHDIK